MERDSRKDEHGYYSLSHGDDDDTASITTPREKVEQNDQSEYTSPRESNADRFEKPHYTSLIIYTICCAAIYPFFYLICWAARGQSLTVVRAVIAIASSIASFALTLSLNEFARKLTEAAAWTTLIQQNDVKPEDRMTLAELKELSSSPIGFLAAFRLVKIRHRIHRSLSGDASSYKHHLWYTYLVFFLIVVIVTNLLSSLWGRTIDVTVRSTFDQNAFDEVAIYGDLSGEDTSTYIPIELFEGNLREGFISNRDTRDQDWDSLPPPWQNRNPSSVSLKFGEDEVYFTEPYAAQLRSDGTGLGAVDAMAKTDVFKDSTVTQQRGLSDHPDAVTLGRGLQYPQWGVTLVCERLPDVSNNIVIYTNGTLAKIPRDFLFNLYSSLRVPFRDEDLVHVLNPTNGAIVNVNVTDEPQGRFFNVILSWDDLDSGIPSRSITSVLSQRRADDNGWTLVDIFVMASTLIESTYLFPKIIESDQRPIGVDAILCLHRTEPWIIEVYNSSIALSARSIAKNLASVDELNTRAVRKTSVNDNVERSLDSRTLNKTSAYWGAYAQSTRTWLKASGSLNKVSHLDISWTDGVGPNNFTTLNPQFFKSFRGATSATTLLPLLVGSQQIVARSFAEKQIAFANIIPLAMAGAIAGIYLAGVIGCFCIPRLPFGHPQRGFDLFSWMIAFKGEKLDVDQGADEKLEEQGPVWRADMNVEEVEKKFGPKKVNYTVAE